MKRIKKVLAALMLMAAVIMTACSPESDPNNNGNDNGGGNNSGGNGTYNGHDYVDLGLPSGTLWATCNVGTDTPEGCGDYFAWGETKTKAVFDAASYKYVAGQYHELTKYCVNAFFGYNGFADNLTTLEPIDDAATANWGSGWCMPSWEQWEELRTKVASMTWTTQNEMYGWLFTGSNGNTLFLPAAGSRWAEEIGYVGTEGFYWSNQLYKDYYGFNNSSCYAYLDSKWIMRKESDRYRGFTVRPVRSSN